MGHFPHLLIPGPWEDEALTLPAEQRHHVEDVLRVTDGERAGYTDGEGTVGTGHYRSGRVVRSDEAVVARPSDLVVVSAPPDSRDRARFLVEKLAELGVAELLFLASRHGQGRPPKPERVRSWAVAGLEQSRGGWLMRTSGELIQLSGLSEPFVVCDSGGSRERPLARTVVIGPEGGWAPGEIPEVAVRWDLGTTVLRVETAGLVAAARLL